MAPVLQNSRVRNLVISPELDSRSIPIDLPDYLSHLSLAELEAFNSPPPHPSTAAESPESLVSKRSIEPLLDFTSSPLSRRDEGPDKKPPETGVGAVPPNAINMKGIQALFALIGAAFVIGGIWFFFWAKNGGFRWRKGDWDDYKSTVLRRKGPDGKTLSNATKSTRLGGGSVVAGGYSDEGTIISDMSSEAPIIQEKRQNKNNDNKKNNKNNKKAAKKEKAGKGLRGGGGKGHMAAAAMMEEKVKTKLHVNKRAEKERQQKQARWEGGFDDDMRAYRHEKPAKVGGLNRGSDAQFYGTDYSGTEPSSFGGGENHAGAAGRRHDSGSGSPRRQQQQQQQYRDSSRYNSNNNNSGRYHSPNKPPSTPASLNRGPSYVDPLDFDANAGHGTKSYHHPIPGLGGGGRRGSSPAAGGGFRAGRATDRRSGGVGGAGVGVGGRGARRRDSLDDSD